MQSNRLAALSEGERKAGNWTTIDQLKIPDNKPVQVWLKDLEFPVLLTKQLFTNKDESTGERFLVSNDLSLTDEQLTTIYKKRWSVEEYHKSLKQNVSIGKSPTRTEKNANESFICFDVGIYQIGKAEIRHENESFCLENKNLHASIESRI